MVLVVVSGDVAGGTEGACRLRDALEASRTSQWFVAVGSEQVVWMTDGLSTVSEGEEKS